MDSNAPKKISLKTLAYIVYGCWAAGVFAHAVPAFIFLPLVSVIIAFIKRGEAGGTIYESHFIWVLRSFVICIVGALLVAVLMIMPPIGMMAMGALMLWTLYRMVKGGLYLLENRPIDKPAAWV